MKLDDKNLKLLYTHQTSYKIHSIKPFLNFFLLFIYHLSILKYSMFLKVSIKKDKCLIEIKLIDKMIIYYIVHQLLTLFPASSGRMKNRA